MELFDQTPVDVLNLIFEFLSFPELRSFLIAYFEPKSYNSSRNYDQYYNRIKEYYHNVDPRDLFQFINTIIQRPENYYKITEYEEDDIIAFTYKQYKLEKQLEFSNKDFDYFTKFIDYNFDYPIRQDNHHEIIHKFLKSYTTQAVDFRPKLVEKMVQYDYYGLVNEISKKFKIETSKVIIDLFIDLLTKHQYILDLYQIADCLTEDHKSIIIAIILSLGPNYIDDENLVKRLGPEMFETYKTIYKLLYK